MVYRWYNGWQGVAQGLALHCISPRYMISSVNEAYGPNCSPIYMFPYFLFFVSPGGVLFEGIPMPGAGGFVYLPLLLN